ncbi:F0F1 ATP synthase subunit delta [Roseicitreum antarcticum]|uniref:ATP synthase subunit delta n=1 Tax=Roseicitreum antarcticum TaxID=564137 RepID=A0A1H2UP00_9RHOB|nr:F0F1 ATP synthase subunit delta [Roseicitreum antarcticum]SDW57866.1 ATP synthase F1 subcomplex delta subunit [Roseicitreum antarcticum]
MSEPASISTGIAKRYATAVFELANEGKALPSLERDVDALTATLDDSAELRDLIASPVYSRDDQGRAITAVARKMGLSDTFVGTLGLMAAKRRLFALPLVLSALRALIADAKGEVTAEVTSAIDLSPAQADALTRTLKARIGKDIKLKVTVDDALIGGLVVKVGSKMIDTSVRSKLTALQNSMKEVG